MSRQAGELSREDDALVSRVNSLLKTRLLANPYGWDGAFAQEISALPAGLRAMAATYHLDISLALDDIGWHFLNFGHPTQVAATDLGLQELGLVEVAAIFREAYQLVQPHLTEIRSPDGDYYAVMERVGAMQRIDELTLCACAQIGEQGIFHHWAVYARQHPENVFTDPPITE
jgi:hypothetical protein